MVDDHGRCEWVNVTSDTGSPVLSRTKSREPWNGCSSCSSSLYDDVDIVSFSNVEALIELATSRAEIVAQALSTYTWLTLRHLCCRLVSHFERSIATWKNDVITKPEVHNISKRRQRRTDPRPQKTCIKIWWSLNVWFLRYACGQADVRYYALHPSRGWSIKNQIWRIQGRGVRFCGFVLYISGFMDDVMFSYNGPYDGMLLRQQSRCSVYTA